MTNYPYLELRDSLEAAADALDLGLRETGDCFRGDGGEDHSPADFAAAALLAQTTAAALREQAAAIRARADEELARWQEDDEYWSRDK